MKATTRALALGTVLIIGCNESSGSDPNSGAGATTDAATRTAVTDDDAVTDDAGTGAGPADAAPSSLSVADAARDRSVQTGDAALPSRTCGNTEAIASWNPTDRSCVLELNKPIIAEFAAPALNAIFNAPVASMQRYSIRTRRLNDDTACTVLEYVVSDPDPRNVHLQYETSVYQYPKTSDVSPEAAGQMPIKVRTRGVLCRLELLVTPGTGAGLVQDTITSEPNDSKKQAAPIKVGSSITGSLTPKDDENDYYFFSGEQDRTYNVSVAFENCDSKPRVTAILVVGSQQQTLGGAPNTPLEALLQFEAKPAIAGPVYLRVNGEAACAYKLTVE